MREVTKQMIREFKIKEKGIDFMGYKLERGIYTFHHLIIPHRVCKELEIGEGYTRENGSILCEFSSHPYLHLIEAKDYDLFKAITNEMIKENKQGSINAENIRYIDDCLTYFEREHCSDRGKSGKLLIKEEYLKRNKI